MLGHHSSYERHTIEEVMHNFRTYLISECVSFRKTNEKFGGLSNMAGGYPIVVNDTYIRTSEALYQAMRFPDYPEIQKEIIEQKSPMTAKMVAKKYRVEKTRADWDAKRVAVMKWCLRVKLVQNLDTFGTLLLKTGNKSIVEESRKDQFWGAIRMDNTIFEGTNALGRLLMELREVHKNGNEFKVAIPPNIDNFKLYGKEIWEVCIAVDKDILKEKAVDRLF